MRVTLVRSAVILLTVVGCTLTAGCSGGGGGGGASLATGAAPTASNSTSNPITPVFCAGCVGPTSLGYNFDTGVAAGPIAAPPPASFGSAPAQSATATTVGFDKTGASYPVTFPLIVTSLKAASPGLSAAPSADGTIIVNSVSPTSFQLVIPSLNVNYTYTSSESMLANSSGWTWGYSYVVAGSWGAGTGQGTLQSNSFYAFGYETPGSGIPTTGSAQYAGVASGNVFQTNNGTILGTTVDGKANLSVNFSSGQVTGSLTQMQQWNGLPTGGPQTNLPWNDVSLSASMVPGTSKFSGTAAATSAPGSSFSLSSSATGHVDGALYGPTAQNVGAVWSLNDGSKSALGALAAKQ
jgi:hypothetical protein